MVQLERELQSSPEMMHGQVSQEIFEELENTQEAIDLINARKVWYGNLISALSHQAHTNPPLLAQYHFLSPGWDSNLFAVVDLHTIQSGEECSICLNEFNTAGGRVRRRPCGHTFHAACARNWFDDMKRNTCPYCRHEYRIIEPLVFQKG